MRQDIKLLDVASKMGFACIKGRAIGIPYKFKKEDINIWECIQGHKIMWCHALHENGWYKQHTYFDNLIDALNKSNREMNKGRN